MAANSEGAGVKGVVEFVVAIGASAGGIDALRPLVARLEWQGSTSFVIAVHLSPRHISILADLLACETCLPIMSAEDGLPLAPDLIYVIPPNRHARVDGGVLRLHAPESGGKPVPRIDQLFESLARDFGPRSVGVILSGTGSDGTAGAEAIHAAGGMILVQEPEEADSSDMPESVRRAGVADHVLDIQDIAQRLNSLGRDPNLADANDDRAFRAILDMVFQATRLDVAQYKEATLRRQIEKQYRALNLSSIVAYLAHLHENPDELKTLQQSFLISVTSFLRDPETFLVLEKLLRSLLAEKRDGGAVRVWVPGCATGEEAYTIAMLLRDILGSRICGMDVRVFATDISPSATEFARVGLYPASSVARLRPGWRERYFVRDGAAFKVNTAVRELCVFSVHDVIRHPPFLNMDLVSCRNLLIYFKPAMQEALFTNFHHALNAGGLLLLGKSESAGPASALFEVLDGRNKLFRCKPASTLPLRFGARTPVFAPLRVSPQARAELPRSLVSEAKDALQRLYSPSGILVGPSFEILHFFGNAKKFLTIPDDGMDFSIFGLCAPELRAELKTLCYRIAQEKFVRVSGVATMLSLPDGPALIRLVLHKLPVDRDRPEFALLICFEDLPPEQHPLAVDSASSSGSSPAEDEVVRLRRDLAEIRGHLQALIGELEASIEKLQSTNEELQSSNEELQSSNEELSTVNDEMRIKSSELVDLNTTLSNIQESIHMALVVVDQDGRVNRFNALAVRIFGLMRGDIGRHLSTIPCYLDLPNLQALIAKVSASAESVIQRTSQGDHHYLMQISPYTNEGGQPTGAVLIFTDISELQRTEDALGETRRQADLLAMLLESSSQPFAVGYPDGRLGLCNAAFRDLVGYTREEMEVLDWSRELTPPEWVESEMQSLRQLNKTGTPTRYQKEMRRKDGTRVPVEVFTHLVRDESGTPQYYYGFITDISERLFHEAQTRRWAQIFENAEFGMAMSGVADSSILAVNPAFARQRGYAPEEMVGKGILDVYAPEEHAKVQARVADLTAAGHGVFESVHITKGGRRFPVLMDISVIRDRNGRPDVRVAYALDITGRKKAEVALHASQERHRRLMDEMLEGCQMIDFDWRYVYVNETTARYGRTTRDALIGNRIMDVYPGMEETELFTHMRQCMHERQPVFVDNEFFFADGSKGWFSLNMQPVPEGIFILALDITERKTAEDSLRESEERFRTVVETAPEAIFIQVDGKFAYVNSMAVRLFGAQIPAQLLDTPVLERMHPDFREKVKARIKRLNQDRQVVPALVQKILRLDGKVTDVEISAVPFTYRGEQGALVFARDITERLGAEKALLAARDAAEVAHRAKSEFLANMSDEIRTPIKALLDMSQVLRHTELTDEQVDFLDGIEVSSSNVLAIFSDILDLSRIEVGKIRAEAQSFLFRTVVQDAVSIQSSRIRQKNLQLDIRIDPDVPAELCGDALRYKQILINLLGNAVKYTERGSITITASVAEEVGESVRIVLRVRDTGIGIEQDALPRIFNPFEQADNSVTRKYGGTGLGLTLSQRMAEMLGGGIQVQSALGEGSEFSVIVPFRKRCAFETGEDGGLTG